MRSDPCSIPRVIIFSDDSKMTLLAVVIARSGVSPFLKDAASRVTMQDLAKYRDQNPDKMLIHFIMEMDNAAN